MDLGDKFRLQYCTLYSLSQILDVRNIILSQRSVQAKCMFRLCVFIFIPTYTFGLNAR